MAKKGFLVLVLASFLAGGVFAQSGKKNFVGASFGLVEGGLHYERMLSPTLSIGIDAYWNSFFFFWNTIGIKASGRLYPNPSKGFFLGLGLGYGSYSGTQDIEYKYTDSLTFKGPALVFIDGFLIEPEIGYKIDIGKPGGFYLEPILGLPLVLGTQEALITWGNADLDFGIGLNPHIHLGIGYAF